MSRLDDLENTLSAIRHLRSAAESATEAETFAVYEEIGELLMTEPMDQDTSDEIQELMGRLVELHKIGEAEDLQRAAIWAADHIETEGMAA